MEFKENITEMARLLRLRGKEARALRQAAHEVKEREVGNKVYLRGLIELSNRCAKNCFYCGIRRDNNALSRYTLRPEEVLQAADFAHKQGFGSVVLQAGECQNEAFVRTVEELLQEIMRQSKGELGITLSLGEQSPDTYRRWRKAGAIRYLLRIETSSPELYAKLHPADHRFEERLACLRALHEADYYVGSGIMIGLPFQSEEQVARDLLFLKEMKVHMVGMGPYIEHKQTPLWTLRHEIAPAQERYELNLNALALLRLLMPHINIAATTAMATLQASGRRDALHTAANVVMPNITPLAYRKDYALYEKKLCIEHGEQDELRLLQQTASDADCVLSLFEQGNPLTATSRQSPPERCVPLS